MRMSMRKTLASIVCCLPSIVVMLDRTAAKWVVPACSANHSTAALPFCNADLPRDTRTWDLIGRLNLTEKVSLLDAGRAWVERLGVHSLEGNECLHGLFNRGNNIEQPNGTVFQYAIDGGVTIFPQSIGMAATFNRSLLWHMGDVISTEAVAKRNEHRRQGPAGQDWPFYLTCWMPVINIARDVRWGRTPETYGEDPLLTRELAAQAVRGVQGDDPRYVKVSAAPKHFTAYDGPESSQQGAPSGRMGFDAEVPPEDLDQTWLDHWKAVIQNSGVHTLGGVMCSYSALDGVPMCGNRRMLTDKLRTEWGHSGWVVSDCGAISNIATQHHFVNSTVEAAALALTAGCDIQCDSAFGSLPKAIAGGLALQADIDSALYRILIQQFQLGVFDAPELNPFSKFGMELVDSTAHRKLAREAAQQSAVLLSNVGRVLPLDKSQLKTIAVLGPSANDTAGYERCFDLEFGLPAGGGCLYSHIYRGYSSFISTPLMGISSALDGTGAKILYASGAAPGQPDGALRNSKNASGVAAAAALAAEADVAIVVVGLEEHFEEEGIDRMDPSTDSGGNGLFQLPGAQQQLVDAVVATKTPVVQVLINGGPLSIQPPSSATKFALLEAFYGAQSCGEGIADVIFGAHPPAGKMPVTVYASPEQVGNITNMDMSKGRTYRYLQHEPLYPFGYGLSYTTWEYTSIRANISTSVLPTSAVAVTILVKNKGTVDSAQVVQLYASFSSDFTSRPANISRHIPLRQLVAFEKIFVKAGESLQVAMVFVPDRLAGWHLFHADEVMLHLAAGDVSPTAKLLHSHQTMSVNVHMLL